MAQNDPATDAQQPAELDLSDLEPGNVVELTYDGSRGSRTVTGYVAHVDTRDALLDDYRQNYEVRIGTPNDHTPRFLRLSFETTHSSEESGTYSFAENYELVRSLNSKSRRGQKLGRVEAIRVTGDTDRRGVEVAQYRDLSEGDRVRVADREATVLDPEGHGVLVEFENGDRETLYARPTDGVRYSVLDEDLNKTVHTGEFEVLPETVEPTDEEADLWDRMTSYGHDYEAGKVEAVCIDGDRYEVVYRPTDSNPTMSLRSPNYDADTARRNYDTNLDLEPTGLRVTPTPGSDVQTRKLDAANVSLVYENDEEDDGDDDSDDDEDRLPTGDDDAEDDDSPEVATDGGRDAIPAVPKCVLCGFRPSGPTEGLTASPAAEIPPVRRDTNAVLSDPNQAPDGKVWTCTDCSDLLDYPTRKTTSGYLVPERVGRFELEETRVRGYAWTDEDYDGVLDDRVQTVTVHRPTPNFDYSVRVRVGTPDLDPFKRSSPESETVRENRQAAIRDAMKVMRDHSTAQEDA